LLKKDQQGPPVTKAGDGVAKAPVPAGPPAPLVATRTVATKPTKAPSPPVPKIDVPKALAQRVVRFDQTKPVPLRDVLNWLEELATVPIRGDRHEIPDLDDLMQTPVTAQLENTTVAAVIQAVLASAGLTYQVQPDALQMHRLGPVSGRPASP
jgi:hypothetical protein